MLKEKIESLIEILTDARFVVMLVSAIGIIAQWFAIDIDIEGVEAGIAAAAHALATLLSLGLTLAGWIVSQGVRPAKSAKRELEEKVTIAEAKGRAEAEVLAMHERRMMAMREPR